jgi:hypothetical protein
MPITAHPRKKPLSTVGSGVMAQVSVRLRRVCTVVLGEQRAFDCWASEGISDRYLNSTMTNGRVINLKRVSVQTVSADHGSRPTGQVQRTTIVDSADRPPGSRTTKV